MHINQQLANIKAFFYYQFYSRPARVVKKSVPSAYKLYSGDNFMTQAIQKCVYQESIISSDYQCEQRSLHASSIIVTTKSIMKIGKTSTSHNTSLLLIIQFEQNHDFSILSSMRISEQNSPFAHCNNRHFIFIVIQYMHTYTSLYVYSFSTCLCLHHSAVSTQRRKF